jgi:hypothetical protein
MLNEFSVIRGQADEEEIVIVDRAFNTFLRVGQDGVNEE